MAEEKSAIETATEAAIAGIEDPAVSAKGEILRLVRWMGELKFASADAEQGVAARIREITAAVREHLASGKYETAVALARSLADKVREMSYTPAPKDPTRDSDQVARALRALHWHGLEIEYVTRALEAEGARATDLSVRGVTIERGGVKEHLSRERIREASRPVTVTDTANWFRQFPPIPETSATES